MRFCNLALMLALALAGLSLSLVSCADDSKEQDIIPKDRPVRASFEPAKLLDFSKYKQMFQKKYSGFSEELMRKKYFFSRALRAFVSAIKYKFRLETSYLAVNHLSDQTPKELARLENHLLVNEEVNPAVAEAKWVRELEDELLRADAETKLKQVVAAALREGLVEGSTAELEADGKLPDLGESRHWGLSKLRRASPMVANQKKITLYKLDPDLDDSEGPRLFQRLQRALGFSSKEADLPDDPNSDKVFIDHRTSGCMTTPRNQGSCGSCTVFSTIAIYEYLYCKQTGRPISFSEQYVVDCGKKYLEGLNGCRGGSDFKVSEFVRNYGLELNQRYPYVGRESSCPYKKNTDMARTGEFRFDVEEVLVVPVEKFEAYLKFGPMTIALITSYDFHEYGGGVHRAMSCGQKPYGHSMVLVGHGREDGREYWLIRNSHGAQWGEQGYYKLSKNARCWNGRYGVLHATDNGHFVNGHFLQNPYYNAKLIDAHAAELKKLQGNETSSKDFS